MIEALRDRAELSKLDSARACFDLQFTRLVSLFA
jgi:hypothetical protein